MKIAIRVDASLNIGTGHVVRCLTLADKLRKYGCEISFVCRDLPGHQHSLVTGAGFKLYRLSFGPGVSTCGTGDQRQNAAGPVADWELDAREMISAFAQESPLDWLIVDHYGLDKRWEERLRGVARKIMVIDDLADRPHDCDLLLDQNLYDDLDTRYNGLVPGTCRSLLGPRHVLLRSEFVEARINLRTRTGEVKRLLLFFGGNDPTNETAKALEALKIVNPRDIAVDVVVGQANPHQEDVRRLCAGMRNVHYHCQVDTMAVLMSRADLAIGAGGTTMWERCFLGLPAIIVTVAANQLAVTASVAKSGALHDAGSNRTVSAESLANTIRHFLKHPVLLKEMGDNALNLMGDSAAFARSTAVQALLEG